MFIPFDLIQRPRLGNLLCFGNDITYTTYLYFIFYRFIFIFTNSVCLAFIQHIT